MSSAEDKVSRKKANKLDDGRTIWAHEGVSDIPVRQRYSTPLLISFKDSSGFKTSSRKALGVLWLRDLVDNEEGQVEIALWHAKHGNYSRLKLNYVPPDGNLEYWDSDKEKIERVGSIFLNIIFRPGLSERHHKLFGAAGAERRGALEEYNREQAAGMREHVGEMDERIPENHQARESHDTEMADGVNRTPPEMDKTLTGGPLNTSGGDSAAIEQEDEVEDTNTGIAARDAQEESPPDSDGNQSSDSDVDAREERHISDGHSGSKGPIAKFKDWKQHEKELHRDHRGVMQAKPARTAQWVKDNVEEGAHAIKDRFKLHSREPDVETEV
ncbi:uncharacterized protein FIBRA_07640 [Fibroporia radiculosa]|uniref:Meiotically up-regulated Mug190 protein third C2 domain-containing protein n=1 Tax=Fibroporia radiculosa TaxID=599839 RepID=J4GF65_9APHY|nr:uncharacterized protein FIBRA_07640 [Fibroporia radiculosa]CCM05423.1 predicted protein [Fibroporia radiculosa]